ncbi:MAG: hydroxymethylpyrimidine/phosphomethylpyrimidine kinase [Sphingobacteriales bacterium]|jgi:hydroxymethylpyrimidine/phosphomethylpyrimidine kinase
MENRPRILCISGFDPSGGAGMMADIRTVESCGGEPIGVLTANTIQNHEQFLGLTWESMDQITRGLEAIQSLEPAAIKLGICQSLQQVNELVAVCRQFFPRVPLVWDPVLKSTSGGSFLENIDQTPFPEVDLITPNRTEADQLNCLTKGDYCLVKSDKVVGDNLMDQLYHKGVPIQRWVNERAPGAEKRGTGCIMSSGIATFLGLGFDLPTAITKTESFLQTYYRSSPGKTGKYVYENH